jgi:hypothetical protein
LTDLLAVVGALLAVMAASELILGGMKLQVGLAHVLLVWAAIYLTAIWVLLRYGDIGPIAFTIFWGGAFLSWFGVRSHIESSILLRMLYLLRGGPLTEAQLLARYSCHYGEAMRIAELERGGLVTRDGGRLFVTRKGRVILAVVAALR